MRKRRVAAADPTRMRLLGWLEVEAMTARRLADKLGVEQNRLYYHLRLLEEAEIVEVVDRVATGRFAERVYGLAYRGNYVWDPERPEELALALGAVLELTKLGAEKALFEQADRTRAGDAPPTITWGRPSFETSAEEIAEFAQRIWDLQQEFRARGKSLPADVERRRLNLTWVLHSSDPESDL